MNSIDRPSSRWSSRTRLSTAPWIETSSAEVISSAITTSRLAGQRAGQRDPLALAAGERRGQRPRPAGVEVDELEQPRDLGTALGARHARRDRLGDALADRHPRVERGVGVLEDHLQRAPPAAARGTGSPSSRIRPPCDRAQADRGAGQRRLAASRTRPPGRRPAPAGTVRLTPSTAVKGRRACRSGRSRRRSAARSSAPPPPRARR